MGDRDVSDLEKNIGSRESLDYEAGETSSDTSTLLDTPASSSNGLSVALPADDATAEQVRTYIIELLTLTHQLPADEASTIASKWTIGSGRELKKFTISMYRDVFGPAAAWVLYKSVHAAASIEKRKASPPMTMPARFGIAGAILAFEVLISLLLLTKALEWLALLVPTYAISLGVTIGLFVDGAEKNRGEDKQVEMALENAEKELVLYWGISGPGVRSSS